jgi:hypothetical protein
VRIHKRALTLYVLDEVYTLDPDGRRVAVDARERFGPLPFLFRNAKRHPAEIDEEGLPSAYSACAVVRRRVGECKCSAC